MAKIYRFPVIKKVMRQFAFKNKEAREEIEMVASDLYARGDFSEEDIIDVLSKVRLASLLEEGIEH